jgi:surfeit locus 1 family protein
MIRGSLRRLFWPTCGVLVMQLILLALGTWQVHRLHWKEAILAQIARAEAAPPVPLSGNPGPFTKVSVTGRLRNDLAASYGADVRDTPTGPQLGTYLIVPLERAHEPTLLVDRGWVPAKRTGPINEPQGAVSIPGYIHPADRPGTFSARDDPTSRTFYTLDPATIGAALGLKNVAPFILIALGPPPPEHYPEPATHLPRPPNNHFIYAVTWYGLALALVVMFCVWARGTLLA